MISIFHANPPGFILIRNVHKNNTVAEALDTNNDPFQAWVSTCRAVIWEWETDFMNYAPELGPGFLPFPIYTFLLCDHISVRDFHQPPVKCWFDFQILNSSLSLTPKPQTQYRSLPVRSCPLGIPTSSNSNSAHPNLSILTISSEPAIPSGSLWH